MDNILPGYKWKILTLLICLIMTSYNVCHCQILNENPGFENGEWITDWKENTNNEKGFINVVSPPEPIRNGNYAIYIENTYGRRMELISNQLTSGYFPRKPSLGPQLGRFLWGKEYWVGISIYLKDWDSDPAITTTLVQAHTIPANWDHKKCCSGDNAWTIGTLTPPRTTKWQGHRICFQANVIQDPLNEIPSCGAFNWDPESGWSVPISEVNDKWTDFVINFRLSTDDNGFIKMWYNDVLVVDQYGPNVHYHASCYGNIRVPYVTFSFGPYKPKDHNTKRSVYFDEIRIAGKDCNYKDVHPRD